MIIHSKQYEELTSDEQVQFVNLLSTASTDVFIGREYTTWINSFHKFILYFTDKQMIGFSRPFELTYDCRVVYRSGTVYLLPQFRHCGYMTDILTQFYKSHRPAVAWINNDNNKSIKLYSKLGFQVDKTQGAGAWWLLN